MTTPVPDASTSDSESVAPAEQAGEVQTQSLGCLWFRASFEIGVFCALWGELWSCRYPLLGLTIGLKPDFALKVIPKRFLISIACRPWPSELCSCS